MKSKCLYVASKYISTNGSLFDFVKSTKLLLLLFFCVGTLKAEIGIFRNNIFIDFKECALEWDILY